MKNLVFFFTSVSLVTGYILHTLITVEVAVNLCRMTVNFNVVFYVAGPVKYIGKNVLEEIFFFFFTFTMLCITCRRGEVHHMILIDRCWLIVKHFAMSDNYVHHLRLCLQIIWHDTSADI